MSTEERTINGRPFSRWVNEGEGIQHWRAQDDDVSPEILCGKCEHDLFRITFGEFECIATCAACGHGAVVYDG